MSGQWRNGERRTDHEASLRVQIHKQWLPSVKAVKPVLQPYFKIRDELCVKDNLGF